jgi:hypothetical protein
MGLVISYTLSLKSATVEEVREKIIKLRNIALKFPKAQVEGLVELAGKNCALASEKTGENSTDPLLSLKIRAVKYGNLLPDEKGNFQVTYPQYFIAFDTIPTDGCSRASFGLATNEEIGNVNDWYWNDYCKNQYASNPEYGGLENYVRSQIFLVEILDKIIELGIECKVNDPTGYWTSRDVKDLTDNVAEANLLMAAIMGSLKDVFQAKGMKAQAPILDYPNFEYLEAQGINDSYKKLSDDDLED